MKEEGEEEREGEEEEEEEWEEVIYSPAWYVATGGRGMLPSNQQD